jgi:hypothetical protein
LADPFELGTERLSSAIAHRTRNLSSELSQI